MNKWHGRNDVCLMRKQNNNQCASGVHSIFENIVYTGIRTHALFMGSCQILYAQVGLVVDILDELSRSMNFTYELYLVPDGIYGRQDANGVWLGMVGELVYGRADLVAADLTVDGSRQGSLENHP